MNRRYHSRVQYGPKLAEVPESLPAIEVSNLKDRLCMGLALRKPSSMQKYWKLLLSLVLVAFPPLVYLVPLALSMPRRPLLNYQGWPVRMSWYQPYFLDFLAPYRCLKLMLVIADIITKPTPVKRFKSNQARASFGQ